jgi:anti-sigma B factor antagonist
MKYDVDERGDVTILDVSGKITIGEGDVKLRKAVHEVLDAGARKIIIDLSGVKYVDSSGIGELVSCYTTITNRGGLLKLANLNAKIYGLLQLTALVTVFQIYDSVEDALQSYSD